MIIVEGCDGSGKTTLVQKLSERYDLPIAPRVKDRDKLREYTVPDTFRGLARAVRCVEAPYIYDRLFFSEMVYAPILRGESAQFNVGQIGFVTNILEACRFPIIICCPDWEVVESNLNEPQHQLEGVREKAAEIYQAYINLFEKLVQNWEGLSVTGYDYTDADSLEEVYQVVESFLSEYNSRKVSFAV